MAVIPLQSNRQVSITTSAPSTITPSSARVDPMAAAVGSIASEASKLTEVLAKREMEQLDLMYKNQIAADASDFHLQEVTKVGELQRTGTGEVPFTQAVMQGFDERARALEDKYPPAYREIIKTKLLSTQEQVGFLALRFSEAQALERAGRNADKTLNHLSGLVQMGAISIDEAKRQLNEEFVPTMPFSVREATAFKGEQQLIKSYVGAAYDAVESAASPAARIAAAEQFLASEGAFLEMGADADFLASRKQGAQRAIQVAKEQQARAEEKLRELADKDPLRAAMEKAYLDTGATPSAAELRRIQVQDLGVHPVDVAVITQADAKEFETELRGAAGNLDAMRLFVLQQKQKYKDLGLRWEDVNKDLSRFNTNLPSVWKDMLEYVGHEKEYDPRYGEALVSLTKDAKAGETAVKNLKSFGVDDTSISEFKKSIVSELGDELRIMSRGGAEGFNREEFIKARTDAALVMVEDRVGKGEDFFSIQDEIRGMVVTPRTRYEFRFDNQDAYVAPLEDGTTPYTKDFMDAIKSDWVDRAEIEVPVTFESEAAYKRHLKNRAGWVNKGETGVALELDGDPVYFQGQQIIETWEGLAADVEDWKAHVASQDLLVPRDTGATIVIDQPALSPASMTFRRKRREAQQQQQNILEPPPVNQKPVGDIQLPGMLPPPRGE